jgi:hypothetical protein
MHIAKSPVLEFGFNEVEIGSEKLEICKTLEYYPNSDRIDPSRMLNNML